MSTESQVVVQKRSLEGQHLFIVDGLFKPDFVRLLYRTARLLPFVLSDFDSQETADVRHWRHDLSPEALAAHPVFRPWREKIEARVVELFAAETGKLRQIYCNNHGYGDHQHIHVDGESGITVLYYVDADWKPDWQGETTLFERSHDIHHAVAPRPGRVLMFPANIPHRGGTPSRTCLERRLVLVLKYDGQDSGKAA